MSESISQLVQDTVDRAQQLSELAWNSLVPPSLANLHDLPAHVHATLSDLVDKLTLRQGVPNPRDWLPDALTPAPAAPAPPPPPPPRSPSWLGAVAGHAGAHPWAYTVAALGLSGGAAYALAPAHTARVLTRLVPRALLPDPKHRPLRLLPAEHGVAAEVRKEAVIVLGADSPQGRDIALDLERRGFVVVATVTDPREVDVLEKLSRGWIKALVLDPNESSSVAPFLRSLSTALSLRFPLHTSGDPFARPAHALALTGVVNCLSLAALPASPTPLEAVENDQARRLVGERIATVVAVVKGLVPLLRSAAARPGAPTGVLVSLVPAASSSLSLPFHALTSAADSAISSLLHSLRRELAASTTSNVHLFLLEVGFFRGSSPATATAGTATAAPLPIRLESVYAPALARRASPSAASSSSSGKCARKGSELRRLSTRVWRILVRPTHANAVERVGAGSHTYALVALLPHALVDLCLKAQDRLYGFYLSHVRRALSGTQRRGGSGERPLPVPPSLRPGQGHGAGAPAGQPSQVPTRDGLFVPHPSPSPAPAPASSAGSEEEEDAASQSSSLEDFGPLGGASTASLRSEGEGSMGESFVRVERE
ncbi:hypothetical protein JCM10450v2_001704 [Rhodotorula kratochvilovae]